MARRWKPKYKVTCENCGWTGIRVQEAKRYPNCDFWHPRKQPKKSTHNPGARS